MRRRDFIKVVAGSASFWPLAARAQQQRMRRVGVLMGWSESDAQYRTRADALVGGLAALGWTDKSNLRLDVRWTNGNVDRARALAKDLVEQQPDVLVAATTPAAAALKRETRTIPIVFAVVSDPVGAGFVQSLPRPGANMTGFINLEASMGGKWLELLKEIAPRLNRVALMFNPDTAPGGGAFFQPAFEAAARALQIETITAPVRSDAEIEKAFELLGRERGGLVLESDSFTSVHRRTIIAGAALQKVPFVSDAPLIPQEGGLIAYGSDSSDILRRSATYIDRILKGANPAELPVQVPTKFELAINLKTAKALGLVIPQTLLATADEVIE
jgi:putative tryptophan/tyrosine transport system substrate-binding protein